METLCYTHPILNPDGTTVLNSIAVIDTIQINNFPHVVIIRGKSINNPILLYLHGGPGRSENSAYFRKISKSLEESFTICYLEQRGSGKSYNTNISPETMTIPQLVSDAKEITLYLIKKFNQSKIFVLGQSWGTILGSLLVNKYPELYKAYIGTGQCSNQLESEKLSLKFIIEESKKSCNQEDIEKIKKLNMPSMEDSGETWCDYTMEERKFVRKYMKKFYPIESDKYGAAVVESPEYTSKEKETFFSLESFRFSLKLLWKPILELNFIKNLKKQTVPIFIFQGIHDHSTEFSLAKQYFDVLEAPFKKFYAFENSAHCPHIEEYERFEKIIKNDILRF